jgi:crotonobetainyl-CoA:carnitine CoA-transferase CaiB-like acyl-CoA transferase
MTRPAWTRTLTPRGWRFAGIAAAIAILAALYAAAKGGVL